MWKLNRTNRPVIATVVVMGLLFASNVIRADVAQDTKITAVVKSMLIKEHDIPANSIKVTTSDNVVHLSGVLPTRLQMHKAIEIAQSVDGVNSVDDYQLQTKDSNDYLRDALITAKAKGKIRQLSSKQLIGKGYNLHVETTNGNVHIFGKLTSLADKEAIKHTIESLEHVKDVKFNVHS